jgi:hypothetical protein
MIFSTRHLENNSIFDFNDISLSPVHMHKHLGVIFSSDCKWTSSANSQPKPVILSATSFIKIRKSNGPKTDPWGTPAINSPVLDIAS